eukprot:TRINITY_DN58190_c0_g1_i1.p3 TRINITY_DN58190_c0_g1~~TRINITY_DN58190_c0_g1_i1.p3  ORF type:complete len:130 (+),score=32.15 TRINITY_DN58190_c0_g1_i1:156-545(+)
MAGQVRGLVLDFDSTISCPTFLDRLGKWAIADNLAVFAAMTLDEIVANFGGRQRVEALARFLEGICAAGVELFIISIGHKAAIVPHLQAVGLAGWFDDGARVVGQDCAELREVEFVKGRLIARLVESRG